MFLVFFLGITIGVLYLKYWSRLWHSLFNILNRYYGDVKHYVRFNDKCLEMVFNVQDDINSIFLKNISKMVYKTIISTPWFTYHNSYSVIFRIYSVKSGNITVGRTMTFNTNDLNKLSIYQHVDKPFKLLKFNDFYNIEYPVVIHLKFVCNNNNNNNA